MQCRTYGPNFPCCSGISRGVVIVSVSSFIVDRDLALCITLPTLKCLLVGVVNNIFTFLLQIKNPQYLCLSMIGPHKIQKWK